MRKLIYAINITLDGCCDHTKTIADEKVMEHYTRLLGEFDLSVYGRKTYQLMVPYWPDIAKSHSETKVENDFADAFVSLNRLVFSRTLQSAAWPQTRIARGETAQEIARLKAEPGGEIIAHGGTQFVRSLVRLGLVDRYRFYVLPFAAGEGVPLFAPDAHPGLLRLEQSTAYPSGILELVYAPVSSGAPGGRS